LNLILAQSDEAVLGGGEDGTVPVGDNLVANRIALWIYRKLLDYTMAE
jgi:hypothetical protein